MGESPDHDVGNPEEGDVYSQTEFYMWPEEAIAKFSEAPQDEPVSIVVKRSDLLHVLVGMSNLSLAIRNMTLLIDIDNKEKLSTLGDVMRYIDIYDSNIRRFIGTMMATSHATGSPHNG